MGLPGTYTRVTLHFRDVTTQAKAQCALFYLISGGGTAPTLATAATHASAFKTAYTAAAAAALPDACEVQKVTLKYVSGGAEVEADNANGVIAGTEPGEYLPEEDVICIQKRTGLVGRSKRGRIFWPFIPEDFQDKGELNGAGVVAAAALATMVKSNVAASGTTYAPHHLDHLNSLLIPIVQTGYVLQTCSRRDRRSPKQLSSIKI